MVSFDALRSAHVGAVSYICKERKPPEELLFCSNFIERTDLSRYNGAIVISGGVDDRSTYVFPCIKNDPRITVTLGKMFNQGLPWSIEFYVAKDEVSASYQLAIEKLRLQNDASAYAPGGVWYDENRVIGRQSGENVVGLLHNAFTYNGTKISYFVNGIYQTSWNGTTSQSNTFSISFSNAYYGGISIISARVIQKCLSSAGSYPVPTAPFTGYEPL